MPHTLDHVDRNRRQCAKRSQTGMTNHSCHPGPRAGVHSSYDSRSALVTPHLMRGMKMDPGSGAGVTS